MNFSVSGSHLGVTTHSELPGTIVAQTYARGQSVWSEPIGVSMVRYEGDSDIRESTMHGRLESQIRFDFGDMWLDTVAAIDASRGAAASGGLLGHIGDAAGLAVTWQATTNSDLGFGAENYFGLPQGIEFRQRCASFQAAFQMAR